MLPNAVLQACDKADGSDDPLVQDPVGCKAKFKPESLRCAAGQSGDACLTDAQIKAIKTLHATYKFPFALANGLDDYPGWGVSGEDTPSFGPTGGWIAWWLGTAAPAQPPAPNNGIAWIYGAGGIQYVFARDPSSMSPHTSPRITGQRLLEVSQLMDSTDPDLGRFRARGGKLIILEHMADYAQSPYAGIRYFENVSASWARRRPRSSPGSTPRPASTMSARARRRMSTCWACWSIGSRTARRRATSRSPSRRSKRLRLLSSVRCRCADGRPGRTTRRDGRSIWREVIPASRN